MVKKFKIQKNVEKSQKLYKKIKEEKTICKKKYAILLVFQYQEDMILPEPSSPPRFRIQGGYPERYEIRKEILVSNFGFYRYGFASTQCIDQKYKYFSSSFSSSYLKIFIIVKDRIISFLVPPSISKSFIGIREGLGIRIWQYTIFVKLVVESVYSRHKLHIIYHTNTCK